MGFYQGEGEVTVSLRVIPAAGWMGPEAQFPLWQDVLGGVVLGGCKGCWAMKSGPGTFHFVKVRDCL